MTTDSFSQALPALVNALLADPFYQAITIDFERDQWQRRRVLASYFELAAVDAALDGRVVVAPDADVGMAIWKLPMSSGAVQSAAKLDRLRLILGPRGLQHYQQIVSFMAPQAHHVVPDDSWYLSIIGISPAAQGQGIGRLLLEPTLQEADAINAPCYLETFNPRSVPFYSSFGFASVAAYVEPVTNCECIVMLRDSH